MTNFHVAFSVFEEEDMLPHAMASLQDKNIASIHVFDGAWNDFSGHYQSEDDTEWIAKEYGGVWHPCHTMWESQEEKRTALFHRCDAKDGDYIFVMDADERLEGDFPDGLTTWAYSVLNKCVGGNDLPDIRTQWPAGDYSEEYIPAIRLFRYDPSWRCLWPGGYERVGRLVPVYRRDDNFYGGWGSILPVVEGLSFTHHGNDRSDAKLDQKRAYYAKEHPRRKKKSQDYHG